MLSLPKKQAKGTSSFSSSACLVNSCDDDEQRFKVHFLLSENISEITVISIPVLHDKEE